MPVHKVLFVYKLFDSVDLEMYIASFHSILLIDSTYITSCFRNIKKPSLCTVYGASRSEILVVTPAMSKQNFIKKNR